MLQLDGVNNTHITNPTKIFSSSLKKPLCSTNYYRNFRSITRMANYPHRPIIAYGEKKSQRITRTGG